MNATEIVTLSLLILLAATLYSSVGHGGRLRRVHPRQLNRGAVGKFQHRADASTRALPYFAPAAVAGGLVGSEFGSRRLASVTIRRLLAVVLVVAGVKMIFV